MSKLDREPVVCQLADELGLNWRNRPVEQVVNYCLAKVARWFPDAARIGSIERLQALLAERLRLQFEDIDNDADLERVIAKYVSQGDIVFAHLRQALDNHTFAELIERRNAAGQPDQYVAVIDRRGEEKMARAFFTRWHELAHMLTLSPRFQPPFNRESREKCPLEQLMDVVAGKLAYYEPLFRPLFDEAVLEFGGLSIEAIERLRERYAPAASFHSTAIAAILAYDRPAMLVSAKREYKKYERVERAVAQTYLFNEAKPEPKLRAVSIVTNAAARSAGLRIDRNMEVPRGSVLAEAFRRGDETLVTGPENLSIWVHSDGSALPPAKVHIEARGVNGTALAFVTV